MYFSRADDRDCGMASSSGAFVEEHAYSINAPGDISVHEKLSCVNFGHVDPAFGFATTTNTFKTQVVSKSVDFMVDVLLELGLIPQCPTWLFREVLS